MESVPVRRRSCLLRLRENCPFRKLRRQKYDVSTVNSSPTASYWNNIGLHASYQPISSGYPEAFPPLSTCCSIYAAKQSEAAADVYMEEDPPAAENQHNQQNPDNRAEDCMDLGDNVDPETGERAQG